MRNGKVVDAGEIWIPGQDKPFKYYWVDVDFGNDKIERHMVTFGCTPDDRHRPDCHWSKTNLPPLMLLSCLCGNKNETDDAKWFNEQRDIMRAVFADGGDLNTIYKELDSTGEYKSIIDRIK